MTDAKQPVLLLSFNRPERTRRVLTALADHRPERLYFAVDGPRRTHPQDEARVREVEDLAARVPWPCTVTTLFREENLGCRLAVSGAVQWFLEQEAEGIVIEDDALPDATFFPFAEELLDRYRHDDRVIAICGEAFAPPEAISTAGSYRFTRMAACKAWALWRRSWVGYTPDLTDWRVRLPRRELTEACGGNRVVAAYWAMMFDQVASGRVDSWAYALMYLGLRRHQLTAVPNRNLVTDTGVGAGATHTVQRPAYFLPAEPLDLPLRHPRVVALDTTAERWTHRHELGLNPAELVRGALKYARLRQKTPGR